MPKTDFKPVMIRNVVFSYPRLAATYKFNTAEKRSEECNPRAQGAAYSIGWEMNKEDAGKLHAELKAHYESCVTKAPFSKVFGMKQLDNGNVMFSAKRNGVNGQGDENPKPTVIDGMKQPMTDLNFWGGSEGNIKVIAYPVTDPNGNGGVSLLIDTAQVTKAVYGGGGLDDFDEVAPTGGSHTEFDAKPAADPFADIPRSANNDLAMDDIPF
jgi:hypothetical protein